MNISYKWLKQYINTDLAPDELAAALTSIGLETGSVERVESIRGGLRGIVIGKVLTCVEHPNSDHLHITSVDLGNGEPTQIVCGAPNVDAGQTVVVATVGTTLYDGNNEIQIKKSKIRGVESFGMICAEDEIGIGTSHDGIIVLPDGAATPGTPAAEYYRLSDDFVFEVDLTPNRIDAASHYGVARDLAAYLACHDAQALSLTRPSVDGFAIDAPERHGVKVSVEDTDACIRYAGLTIDGVKVTESPDWLKHRLTTIGMHPINNIVDITNYILHGFGQPLHCFDRAKIAGDTVVVRKAKHGSKFTTLDGAERTLDSADLMICDAENPMCIAGVFGGLNSGVTEETTSVFIESACFHPTSVRKTARRHGLNTDASFRYERGVDPNGCIYAMKLAALLVKELAGGEIVGETIDIYPSPVNPYSVELSYTQVDSMLGQHIDHTVIDGILKSLEIEITAREGDNLSLAVPTYRVDVRRACDVIEDILRIYGYNNIAMTDVLHASLSFKTDTDRNDDLRRTIAGQLTAAGFNEILNNSLTAEAYYAGLTEYPADHCVRLLNPLSQDLNVMRQTLLFGGLESLAHNINRKSADLAMYEFGNVYFRNPDAQPTAETPLAPYHEGSRLALWMSGASRTGNWARPTEEASFFDLKAAVANIFTRLGISRNEIALTPVNTGLLAPAMTINTRSGKALGTMGIVRADIARRFGLKQQAVFAELDWDALSSLVIHRQVEYTALPKTQPVKRDLSLLIDCAVSMADIEKVVRESERRLLRSVTLFDVYEGKNLPQGKKSYAISLTLQDDEKTLQEKHIDQIMSKIISNLQKQLNAELR